MLVFFYFFLLCTFPQVLNCAFHFCSFSPLYVFNFRSFSPLSPLCVFNFCSFSPLCVFNVSSPSHKLCELPHFQSKPLISSFLLRCNSAALARHRLQMDVKSFPAFKSRRMPEKNASTDSKRRFFQKCVLATRSDWQKAHRLLYFQSFHTLFLKR